MLHSKVTFSLVVGLAVECILAAPLLLFGTAASDRAPLLTELQKPGAVPILWLFEHTKIRNLADHFPGGPLLAAQCSVILLQAAIFSLIALCLIYSLEAIRKNSKNERRQPL